jgi:hypothetical protein
MPLFDTQKDYKRRYPVQRGLTGRGMRRKETRKSFNEEMSVPLFLTALREFMIQGLQLSGGARENDLSRPIFSPSYSPYMVE